MTVAVPETEPLVRDAEALEAGIAPARHPDARRALAIARAIAAQPVRDPRARREILDEAWGHDDRRR